MTRRYHRSRRDVPGVANHALTAVACFVAGAGAMHLLNPSNGFRRRRANDRVIRAQVASAVAGSVTRPTAVRSSVSGGIVTLRGDVPLVEVDGLLRAVYAVDGVRDITNRLHEIPNAEHRSAGTTERQAVPPHAGERRVSEYAGIH